MNNKYKDPSRTPTPDGKDAGLKPVTPSKKASRPERQTPAEASYSPDHQFGFHVNLRVAPGLMEVKLLIWSERTSKLSPTRFVCRRQPFKKKGPPGGKPPYLAAIRTRPHAYWGAGALLKMEEGGGESPKMKGVKTESFQDGPERFGKPARAD